MATDITYRPAQEADLPQIRAINAHYILHTCATLKRTVPPLSSYLAKWQALQDRGLPYLVAADPDSAVLGYACLSPYRASYPPTVELSLFVHPLHQSRAVGSALLGAILRAVREGSVVHRWAEEAVVVRSVVAVMAVDREAKEGGEALRRFYRRRGFEERGRLVKAGWKRGCWIDVIHFQFSTFEE